MSAERHRDLGRWIFGTLTVAWAAVLYGPHWSTWLLALTDEVGQLRGQPWPGSDADMLAMLYWVNPDSHREQLLNFAGDLVLGAIAAMLTMCVLGLAVEAVRDRRLRRAA